MFSSTTSTHEKIWLDKSIYDLAEKKYYEKLARTKENSSSSCKEQKTEAVSQESPKKCFVGLEKDGTGTYKAPEKVWVDKRVYDLAEKEYYEKLEKGVTQNANTWNSLAGEVAKARQHIKNSLQCIDDIASITSNNVIVEVNNRINTLELENTQMKQRVKELTDLLSKFEERLTNIEKKSKPTETVTSRSVATGSSANLPKQQDEDEDDGVDLFASDSEEENAEATKIKEQRLAEYAAKKSKKPAIIAKSSIVLDVKPWDDTTDMKLMEEEVRKIKTDGLLWGASKLVPLAYGIHKLQISCVVEDEKVSVDWLQETIETIEDYVQSVDIAAFNKI
uniref:Putative elongation factor 1 delta n=1 Tax=Panstrongylus megistus TaxID=65343 RepID=A0A069DS83_9HEMI